MICFSVKILLAALCILGCCLAHKGKQLDEEDERSSASGYRFDENSSNKPVVQGDVKVVEITPDFFSQLLPFRRDGSLLSFPGRADRYHGGNRFGAPFSGLRRPASKSSGRDAFFSALRTQVNARSEEDSAEKRSFTAQFLGLRRSAPQRSGGDMLFSALKTQVSPRPKEDSGVKRNVLDPVFGLRRPSPQRNGGGIFFNALKTQGRPKLEEDTEIKRRKGLEMWSRAMEMGSGKVKEMVLPLSQTEASRSSCKAIPFIQNISEPKCETITIQNRFCFGQCSSFYIPDSSERRLLHSCSRCAPSKVRKTIVSLKCHNGIIADREATHIEECECEAQNEAELLYHLNKLNSAK
nr:PREDICTED: DAN domain family member 5 [Latimeria chalumnae]|eukprot:XP_005994221.1 PREDICTED: DAN domain family member 5 [Latimeria chalumnae]